MMYSGKDIKTIRSEHGAFTPEKKLALIDKNKDLLYKKFDNPLKRESPEDFVNFILERWPDNDELNLSIFYDDYADSIIMLKAFNNLFHHGIDCRYRHAGNIFSWQNCIETVVAQGTITAMQVMGAQGIGKTVLSQEIALELSEACKKLPVFYMNSYDPNMCYPVRKSTDKTMVVRVTYGYDETIEKFPTQPENSILVQDESDRLSGKNSEKTMWALKAVLGMSVRALGIRIIFNDSQLVLIPQIRYYIEVVSRNKARNQSLTRIGVPGKNGPVWRGVVVFDTNRLPGLYDVYVPYSIAAKKARLEMAGQHQRKGGEILGPANEISSNFLRFIKKPENISISTFVLSDRKGGTFKDWYIPRYEQRYAGDMDIEGISKLAWGFINIDLGLIQVDAKIKAILPAPEIGPKREPLQWRVLIPREQVLTRENRKVLRGTIVGFGMFQADPATQFERIVLLLAKRDRKARKSIDEAIEKGMHEICEVESAQLALDAERAAEYIESEHILMGKEQRFLDSLRSEGFDVEWTDIEPLYRDASKMDDSELESCFGNLKAISEKRKESKRFEAECKAGFERFIQYALDEFRTEAEKLLDRIRDKSRAGDVNEPAKKQEASIATETKPVMCRPGELLDFSADTTLEEYVHDGHGTQREVDIFNALKTYSPKVVADKYTNETTGKSLTKPGLTKIEAKVSGFFSLKIGHAYEPQFAVDKEKELKSLLAGPPIVSDDAGQGVPDTIFPFTSGDFAIYSLKCRYSSMTETQMMYPDDFTPEREKWYKLVNEWARAHPLKADEANAHVQLWIVYYDENCKEQFEKQVPDPENFPEKVRLTRASGHPDIKFVS